MDQRDGRDLEVLGANSDSLFPQLLESIGGAFLERHEDPISKVLEQTYQPMIRWDLFTDIVESIDVR